MLIIYFNYKAKQNGERNSNTNPEQTNSEDSGGSTTGVMVVVMMMKDGGMRW